MEVIELIEEMRNICETLRREGKRIRLVPTMGALHIGHASLIRNAIEDRHFDHDDWRHGKVEKRWQGSEDEFTASNQSHLEALNLLKLDQAEPSNLSPSYSQEGHKSNQTQSVVVIVSIFLNPKQFNNPADYVNYPNTRSADLELCKRLNVRYVFAPTLKQLYPDSGRPCARLKSETVAVASEKNLQCMVTPPDRIAKDLEGKSRPGHFKGMLTVVCKLFNMIRPHEAYFGEKDYQQLILVTQMCRELNLNVNVRPVPTVRDHDLLPLSSRNVRLSESQRQVAPVMCKILTDAKQALEELNNTIDDVGIYLDSDNKRTKISSLLTASMLTTLCLYTDEQNAQLLDIDYLELRCANDVTRIDYQNSNRFDCEQGCVERQLGSGLNDTTLKARLLISVVVGEVRLLDNIEVLMNLNKVSK